MSLQGNPEMKHGLNFRAVDQLDLVVFDPMTLRHK